MYYILLFFSLAFNAAAFNLLQFVLGFSPSNIVPFPAWIPFAFFGIDALITGIIMRIYQSRINDISSFRSENDRRFKIKKTIGKTYKIILIAAFIYQTTYPLIKFRLGLDYLLDAGITAMIEYFLIAILLLFVTMPIVMGRFIFARKPK